MAGVDSSSRFGRAVRVAALTIAMLTVPFAVPAKAAVPPLPSPAADAVATAQSVVGDQVCNPNNLDLVRVDPAVGSTWRSYKVHVPAGGGMLWASINGGATADDQQTVWQVHFFSGDGTPMDFLVVGMDDAEHVVINQSPPAASFGTASAAGCSGALAYGTDGRIPEGDYYAVLIATNKGVPTNAFAIWGTPGVAVAATNSGSNAFMHELADFSGGPNSSLYVPAAGINQASADNVSVTEFAAHHMIAAMSASNPDTRIGYDEPGGSHDGQSFYCTDGELPGAYRFRVDHDRNDNLVWVAGADVVLP